MPKGMGAFYFGVGLIILAAKLLNGMDGIIIMLAIIAVILLGIGMDVGTLVERFVEVDDQASGWVLSRAQAIIFAILMWGGIIYGLYLAYNRFIK